MCDQIDNIVFCIIFLRFSFFQKNLIENLLVGKKLPFTFRTEKIGEPNLLHII